MSRRYITLSDFTQKEIKEGEAAQVVVLTHPSIDAAVKLDAGALEVAGLKGASDFVEIELTLPSTPPERLVIDLATFNKLFKGAAPDDVLGSAERYSERPTSVEPKRRGRPPRQDGPLFPKVKRDPQQLAAIRDWWRSQGNEIGDRGRIPQTVEDQYNEAHKG